MPVSSRAKADALNPLVLEPDIAAPTNTQAVKVHAAARGRAEFSRPDTAWLIHTSVGQRRFDMAQAADMSVSWDHLHLRTGHGRRLDRARDRETRPAPYVQRMSCGVSG